MPRSIVAEYVETALTSLAVGWCSTSLGTLRVRNVRYSNGVKPRQAGGASGEDATTVRGLGSLKQQMFFETALRAAGVH